MEDFCFVYEGIWSSRRYCKLTLIKIVFWASLSQRAPNLLKSHKQGAIKRLGVYLFA